MTRTPLQLIRNLPLVCCTVLLTCLMAPSALAQTVESGKPGKPQPSLVNWTWGEGGKQELRQKWFFENRRAGVNPKAQESAGARLRDKRNAAMTFTKEQLLKQRKQWAELQAKGLPLPAGANVWSPVGPAPSTFGGWAFGTVSGRVIAAAVDSTNNILYVGGASGGLWKSTDGGTSWTHLLDAAGSLAVGAVTIDPNNANTLWVGSGENTSWCESYFGVGLLRSTDGGATWQTMNGTGGNTLNNLSAFADIIVDPRNSNRLIVGGRYRDCVNGNYLWGGLYTSDDGGANWTERLSSAGVTSIIQNPADPDILWAGVQNGGIYKSTDGGNTWVQQTTGQLPRGNVGRAELALAPSDPDVVYALFSSAESPAGANNYTPRLWRTQTGGTFWTEQVNGSSACDGQCSYNMTLLVHPTTPTTVYRGTVRLYRSTNSGTAWTDLINGWGGSQKVHQDIQILIHDPAANDGFYVGSDGGFWRTTDLGNNFTNLNGNMNLTQFYAIGNHPTDDGKVLGGAQDNSSLARDGSDTWALQQVTGDGFVCHFNPDNPDIVFIAGYPYDRGGGTVPSVYRSTTGIFGGFSHVSGTGNGITGGDRSNWVTPYIPAPSNPDVMFLGTHRMYKSVDTGVSWTQVGPTDMTAGSGTVLSMDVHPSTDQVVWAGTTDGRVWTTSDGGSNWQNVTGTLPARAINDLAAHPTDTSRAFAVLSGFGTAHLYEYDGANWNALGAGLPDVPANTVLALSANEIFVGADTGVFQSTDGGANFVPFMNGLPEGLVVTDLKYAPATLTMTAGTYGRGAWQITMFSNTTDVRYYGLPAPVEVDGDGDGTMEPGEIWDLSPQLRNVGAIQADGVTAGLTADHASVQVLTPSRTFGNLGMGVVAGPTSPFRIALAPDFPCGETVNFSLTGIASTNTPFNYGDENNIFSALVEDPSTGYTEVNVFSENFDPDPGWSHEVSDPGISGCETETYVDEWGISTARAVSGNSMYSGTAGAYALTNSSWLYLAGKDSAGGPGITIPNDPDMAALTFMHWFDTEASWDGGLVAVDDTADGADAYATLTPSGGYTGSLGSGYCNALQGQGAFTGANGAWQEVTVDLSAYIGQTIWIAFVFGADNYASSDEGWYIDDVSVDALYKNPPVCHVSEWPGLVPGTAAFARQGNGDITATWSDSCNSATLPGQGYSLQVGDLDSLGSGPMSLAPLGGTCGRVSPLTFTPGSGNEFYILVPNEGGRDGGMGTDSSGTERPLTDGSCGDSAFYSCP